MAPLGISNTQADTGSSKITCMLFNNRLTGICKVNKYEAAYRGNHLIHQAALLAKIMILSQLPHLGNFHSTCPAIIIILIQNSPHQHLKGRRGGQAAAPQHIRGHIGIKTADVAAQLCKLSSHAANQGGCRTMLRLICLQSLQVNQLCLVPLGLQADNPLLMKADYGNSIQIDSRSQHASPLMVSVVAAYLGAPRCGENPHLLTARIQLLKTLQCPAVTLPLSSQSLSAVHIC